VQLLLVFSDVLDKLNWVQKTFLGEYIKSILTSGKHEILLGNWQQLLSLLVEDFVEFGLVERFVEINERLHIIQVSLTNGIGYVILVVVQLTGI